jgi:hypothetical protein
MPQLDATSRKTRPWAPAGDRRRQPSRPSLFRKPGTIRASRLKEDTAVLYAGLRKSRLSSCGEQSLLQQIAPEAGGMIGEVVAGDNQLDGGIDASV